MGLVDDEGLVCTTLNPCDNGSIHLPGLLRHADHLQEAKDLIEMVPWCKPDAALWMAMVGACRIHGNVEMGEHVANKSSNWTTENARGYVVLSNIIYAAGGNWDLSKNV